MPWRMIFIGSLLLIAMIGNGALLWYERIDPPATVAALQDNVRAVNYIFIPSKRTANFTAMGLGDKVGAAVGVAAKLDKSEARIRSVIEESADEVKVLCTGRQLPPRFAALAILVEEDADGVRRVIHAGKGERATAFFEQEWFAASLTAEVFAEMELNQAPPEDATAMGVAAILANAESLALSGDAPFDRGFGGTWGLDEVFAEYGWVEAEIVRYFALMHVMTEIARSEKGGICG
ncbi:MAG: hypothetical protein KC912_04485 [Proteobacteria bacterium]|nr:hypothetical protein [Pseudomonadota bacterium]